MAPKEALWRLSLRYHSAEMEASFLRSRRPLLVRRSTCFLGVYLAVTCCTFLLLVEDDFCMKSGSLEFEEGIAGESQLVLLTSEGLLMLLDFLLFGSLCFRQGRVWGHVWLEAAMIASMVLSMAVFTFCQPMRYVKLRGYKLEEVFESGYGSDSTLLLVLDSFVTVAHLGLPVRWHIMAPLELAALLLYGLHVLLVGSEESEDQVFSNVIALGVLVGASALAKRYAEQDERGFFRGIIGERELRCQAEFQLAQAQQPAPQPAEDLSSVGRRSDAVTDRSGGIFDENLFEGDVTAQLELVAAKGASEHWLIGHEEIKVLGELGKGGFGSVQKGVFCGMMVAVKCPRLEKGASRLLDLCNELRVLRHLRHPHIVAVHGAVVLPQEQQLCLVLELVQGKTMTEFLLGEDQPSTLQRYQVMLGVCQALFYMHGRVPHVVHGDLKGDNIMIELAGTQAVPKLLDFGLSRLVNRHTRALGGTMAWVAPEVLGRAPVRCSADVYSFGHLIVYCSTSIRPTKAINRKLILGAMQSLWAPPPLFPDGCPFGSCSPLVQQCLQQKPEQRPTMQQVHQALLGLPAVLRLSGGPFLQQVQDLSELAGGALDVKAFSAKAAVQSSGLPLKPKPEEQVPPPPPAPVSPRRMRPIPELNSTSVAAMQATLLAAFRRWNCDDAAGGCCRRHACARVGQALLAQFLAAPCVLAPLIQGEQRQCGSCGALGMAERQCDLCGWDAESEEVRSSEFLSSSKLGIE